MGVIITRRPWTRQPPGPASVDWGNPLASKLAFLTPMTEGGGAPRDLVSGLRANVVNGSWTVGAKGRATAKASGNTASFTWTDFGSRLLTSTGNGLGDFSFVVLAAQTSTAVGCPVSVNDPTGTYPIFHMLLNGTGDGTSSSGTFDTFTFDSGFSGTTPISSVVTANDPQVYGYSRTSALQKGYARGVMGASSAYQTLACIRSASDLVIQGRADAAKPGADLVFFVAAWNRALSDSEHASLAVNPWQLLTPLARRIWVPSAAASAVPNITFVGAENITATSADYRVTLDYA